MSSQVVPRSPRGWGVPWVGVVMSSVLWLVAYDLIVPWCFAQGYINACLTPIRPLRIWLRCWAEQRSLKIADSTRDTPCQVSRSSYSPNSTLDTVSILAMLYWSDSHRTSVRENGKTGSRPSRLVGNFPHFHAPTFTQGKACLQREFLIQDFI